MWLTIYTSKSNFSLDARFFPTLKPMAIIFFTRVLPESLESQGSALGVIRVFFPKIFKNKKNRRMSGNSVRYPCTVKYLWLGSVSAAAIFKLALKIYFAMNCNDEFNETFSFSAGTGTIAIKAPMNNELWISRLMGRARTMNSTGRNYEQWTLNIKHWILHWMINNKMGP